MKQEDTKKKILEKALELFAANGYDAVSVGEIAKAVGIKAPSLYSHYPSKQAIFNAVFENTKKQYEEYTERLSVHMRDSEKDKDMFSEITEEMLVRKVRQIFLYSLHDKEISRFRRMMTIEQFRTPELSKLYTERYVESIIEYHTGVFKGLIAAGRIKNEDPVILAMMYASPIITLLGVCDRQPEREEECIKKLDKHVGLFYRTFTNI